MPRVGVRKAKLVGPSRRVITRASLTGHDPARGSGQVRKLEKISRVEAGRGRRCSICHGLGWVGSGRGFVEYDTSGRVTMTRSDPRGVILPLVSQLHTLRQVKELKPGWDRAWVE